MTFLGFIEQISYLQLHGLKLDRVFSFHFISYLHFEQNGDPAIIFHIFPKLNKFVPRRMIFENETENNDGISNKNHNATL